MKKILLSVAGFDPTAGAGIILDINTFQNLGFLGMGIITSSTEQNTQGAKSFFCIPAPLLWKQYQTIQEDVSISGIKVGMMGNKENIKIVSRILSQNCDLPKVIDPVFKASSGLWLIDKKNIPYYLKKIKGKASLLTPNLEEASLISGIEVKEETDMKKAAQKIFNLTEIPCLIKGGHLPEEASDLLYDGYSFQSFKRKKLNKKVHGTGCFYSSSLLAYLVKKKSLKQAVYLASQFTYRALIKAQLVGKGQYIIKFPVPSSPLPPS